MKAAIALLADHRTQNTVRRIVYDLNRQYGIGFLASLLPAHVSLKQPFGFENMEKLERYFDQLAEDTAPVDIELDGVYHSQWGGYGILGFRVQETTALRTLHNRINSDLTQVVADASAPHDGKEYRFHMTIELGEVQSDDVYERYYASMSDRDLRLSFTARTIALFYYDGTEAGSYMAYKVLPFIG